MIRPAKLFTALAMAAVLAASSAPAARGKDYTEERERMVDKYIAAAGVKDARVLKSMRETPRHEFVNAASRSGAYYDMAMPIGHGQTISPPFVVAYMTEQLEPKPTDNVLEVGTGSGFQAAVLSPLVKDVYTIEIVKELGDRAARTLKRLKYANVHSKVGDGYQGWAEHAPFDKIIVTCSPEKVPQKLIDQLREGGRMIVPVGQRYQQTLYLFEKKDGKLEKIALLPTLFVPMTGQAETNRVVKPDPLHPSLANGGFEELSTVQRDSTQKASSEANSEDQTEQLPAPWYYQRQMKVEDKDAPQGDHFVTFTNNDPGRAAVALQGMAVDGRKVNELKVTLSVKMKNIRAGETADQQPMMVIVFYDEKRMEAGTSLVGPWRETAGWQQVSETVHVPAKAREAIVRIGLNGAVGEVSFDDIKIQAAN